MRSGRHPWYRSARALLIGLSLGLSGPAAADLTTTTFIHEWGTKSPQGQGEFYYTVSNAVHDSTGDVYTIEANLLQKFDRNGTFLYQLSCLCAGIDVNQVTGDFYVSLDKGDAIEQYTSSGVFVRTWGTSGTGPGQFNAPWGIAVDSNTGNVYVMDSGNARVQLFDPGGNYISEFTSAGLDGPAREPGGIAFDPAGNWVYVTDAGNDIVEKFDSAGNYLLRIGTEDNEQCAPGFLRWARGVAVDSAGLVYVTSNDCERIEVFSSAGAHVSTFMGPNNVIDGPSHPRDVAINLLTGEKYVNAAYAARVDKFDAANTYLFSWGGRKIVGHYLLLPRGIAVSPTTGDTFVFDSQNTRLKRFTAGGAFLNQWGNSLRISLASPGLFGSFGSMALDVDGAGDVWAGITGLHYPGDPSIQYVQKFDPLGTHLQSIFRTDLSGKYSERVSDVAVDKVTGDIWVADSTILAEVKKYDSAGNLLLQTKGGLIDLAGIAVSATHVYVADHFQEKIFKFDKAGNPGVPASFGTPGSADGQLNLHLSSSLTTDSLGNIYVADTNNDRIQQFDPAGTFMAKFGVSGNGVGQFNQPMQVGLSADDNILQVVDRGRSKVLTFCLNSNVALCTAQMDVDTDTILDFPDNCPFFSNVAQNDNGGLSTVVADGVGDDCQCGELDDTGDIAGTDLTALRDFLAGIGGPIASDRCSVIGGTECDVADAAVLTRALGSLEPGLAQVCAPAVP